MAFFKKKADPISDRAKALSDEIAALEARIKKLDTQLQHQPQSQPRLRPAAMPHGAVPHRVAEKNAQSPANPPELILEKVDQKRLDAANDAGVPEHFNELGVRKYDLPALIQRIKNHFHGPSTNNPKLVNLLAAGGVQGLRPMRYEKRIARTRLIVLVAFLFLMLFGIIWIFLKHR